MKGGNVTTCKPINEKFEINDPDTYPKYLANMIMGNRGICVTTDIQNLNANTSPTYKYYYTKNDDNQYIVHKNEYSAISKMDEIYKIIRKVKDESLYVLEKIPCETIYSNFVKDAHNTYPPYLGQLNDNTGIKCIKTTPGPKTISYKYYYKKEENNTYEKYETDPTNPNSYKIVVGFTYILTDKNGDIYSLEEEEVLSL